MSSRRHPALCYLQKLTTLKTKISFQGLECSNVAMAMASVKLPSSHSYLPPYMAGLAMCASMLWVIFFDRNHKTSFVLWSFVENFANYSFNIYTLSIASKFFSACCNLAMHLSLYDMNLSNAFNSRFSTADTFVNLGAFFCLAEMSDLNAYQWGPMDHGFIALIALKTRHTPCRMSYDAHKWCPSSCLIGGWGNERWWMPSSIEYSPNVVHWQKPL